MPRAARLVAAALLGLAAAPACAAEVAPPLPSQFIGNTLSAVTYVPHPPGMPGPGSLSRFMFQAYLRGDGRALVRVWDEQRDAYTPLAERQWSLAGSNLCIDLRGLGPGRVCAEVHIWGPRIAGVGIKPYAMVDGDLQPGDALLRR